MHDLIIVGGGASGFAAGVFALSKELDFRIIYENRGGKSNWRQSLTNQKEQGFLAGAEALMIFERQVEAHRDSTVKDRVTAITKKEHFFEVKTTRRGVLQSAAVIVCTGVTPIKLDIPGADMFLGYGLGYSAITHTALLDGRCVAVIGATDRALRGAAEISQKARQVYLITPNDSSLLTPLGMAVQYRPNVEVFQDCRLLELTGSLSVERLTVEQHGEVHTLNIDAAFVDLGLLPNSECVRKVVRTDRDGFVWVDDRNATSLPGLFAAGDVTTTFGEQALIAIGEGARAALSAYDYILEHSIH
ncbi:MAG: NAD(P)/FAD-dependent oxidoreductase [Chloroflexota bacterium]